MNMKDYWTQKLDGYGYGFDTKIVLDEYDRNVTKLEALQNKFKPGYTVKYTGNAYNHLRNEIGVVKYVNLNYAGAPIVVVSYKNEKYDYCLDPKYLNVIKSVKRIKNEFTIKKIIFNNPATIVFWEDDTKTVVKCGKRDTFDCEKGVAMVIAKKALGNTKDYYKEIKKFLPKEEERKKSLASDEELINLMLKVFGVVDEDYS